MTRAPRFLLCHEDREGAEAIQATLLSACPGECRWVDGLQALNSALLEAWNYDLLFARVGPGSFALEALRQAGTRRPGLPFLGLCVSGEEAAAAEWFQEGGTDCLPLDAPVRLARGIRRALAEARAQEELRGAQEAAARMAAMLRATLEATSEGILISDLAGRVTLYNSQLMALCGLPAQALAPMKVEEVLRFLMDQFQDPAAFLTEALHPKASPEDGLEGIITSAGRDLEARLMVTRVRDNPDGRVLRVREASRLAPDQDAQSGDEALLRAAARHLGEPMEKLGNRLELLTATHPLTEAQRRHLAAAREAQERLEALLGQLRGPAPGDVREVELNALLEGLRPRAEVLLPEGMRLRLEPAAGLPPLAVDPAHVEHVVLALVANAREASPTSLALRTGALPRAATGERRLFLELEDDGHGLAAGVRAQLFRPFFTTRPGRTGLGLWTARSLLALYGGTLTAEPVVPRGTRFRAEWPALL